MKRIRTARTWRIAAALCLGLLLLGGPTWGEERWNVTRDLGRLASEAPSLAAFPDSPGVVWLRQVRYSLLADGTLERGERWLLLAGERLPESWSLWRVPVPPGGSARVEEGGWYNPLTSQKEGDLTVVTRKEPGMDFLEIRVPREAAGRVVALSTVQRFPGRTNVDGVLFLALDLPVWEQSVVVEVPGDKRLYWTARGVGEPRKTSDRGTDRYEWTLRNQAPWQGGSLVEDRRPALAFSLRKGLEGALASLGDREVALRTVPLPGAWNALSRSPNVAGRGEKLLQHLAGVPSLPGLPWYWIRTAPPEQGPWTEGERTLLASAWLRRLGWTVSVWWQPLLPAKEDGPATDLLWLRPVLEVSAPGVPSTFYFPGQAAALGQLAPNLYGQTLYRLEGEKVLSRELPRGDAKDHRLSVRWTFGLNDLGVGEGTLEMTVRGAWVDLLAPEGLPTPEKLEGWMAQRLLLSGPRLRTERSVLEPLPSGFRLRTQVRGALGIAQGPVLLLRLPTAVPALLETLLKTPPPYTLRFPFILEQDVTVALPPGYEMLAAPPLNMGEGLQQKLVVWPKKGSLEAENRWIVKGGAVDAARARTLGEQLVQVLRTLEQGIPLKKR